MLQLNVNYGLTLQLLTPIILLMFLSKAPVAAPRSLTVANVTDSSTMLSITWDRPVEIDINGQLKEYVILYSIAGVNKINNSMNVTGDTLKTVLDGLENFTRYNVYVSASTIDLGPFAEGSERTSENGNCFSMFAIIFNSSAFLFIHLSLPNSIPC